MLPYTPAHFFRTFSLRLYYSFFDASIFDIIDQKEINIRVVQKSVRFCDLLGILCKRSGWLKS